MINKYLRASSFFTLSGLGSHGQTLPAKVGSYLNSNYPSWKFDWEKPGRNSVCGPEVKNSVVSGYFNNDKNRDYVVKFVKGRSGYVLAFVSQGANFQAHVLESISASDLRTTVLSVERKGGKYPIGGDIPDLVYGRLPNDAPYTIPCASDAVAFFVFRNGRFQ